MATTKQTFESAMKNLQKIADQLEAGNLSLEQSLKLYEEGIGLTSFCEKELKCAKLKISELKDTGDLHETDE
ncbi:MAG: exodeoxyribonuclease VII small subunit [Oscillospiraceae bacterium]